MFLHCANLIPLSGGRIPLVGSIFNSEHGRNISVQDSSHELRHESTRILFIGEPALLSPHSTGFEVVPEVFKRFIGVDFFHRSNFFSQNVLFFWRLWPSPVHLCHHTQKISWEMLSPLLLGVYLWRRPKRCLYKQHLVDLKLQGIKLQITTVSSVVWYRVRASQFGIGFDSELNSAVIAST